MSYEEMVKQSDRLTDLIKELKINNIPEHTYKDYLYRFIEKKARKVGVPLNGVFELTPLCNLDCKMCYVHLRDSSEVRHKLISATIFNDLIDQAHDLGMIHATLTGGECLTYPEFDKVYLHLYSKGIKPIILSNGVLIDENRIGFFKRNPPQKIQISLYGSSEENYQRVTGHRVFRKVFQNILNLRDANIPLSVTITPNRYMQTDFRSFLEMVISLGVPYNINSGLIKPRNDTGRDLEDITVDQYIELYKIKNELHHGHLYSVDPTELPDVGALGDPQKGLRCGAGRSSFGVRYDGLLCPCLSLDEITADPINDSFKKAWKYINNVVNNYPLPKECCGCAYASVCLPCIAMHKNYPQKGHCDPLICDRTKKMVSNGFFQIPFNKE